MFFFQDNIHTNKYERNQRISESTGIWKCILKYQEFYGQICNNLFWPIKSAPRYELKIYLLNPIGQGRWHTYKG